MTFQSSRPVRWMVAAMLALAASPSRSLADDAEPIAYVGHGGFFDHAGKQIPVTLEFIERSQAYYRARLLAEQGPARKLAFARFEKRLLAGPAAEGQARLV